MQDWLVRATQATGRRDGRRKALDWILGQLDDYDVPTGNSCTTVLYETLSQVLYHSARVNDFMHPQVSPWRYASMKGDLPHV